MSGAKASKRSSSEGASKPLEKGGEDGPDPTTEAPDLKAVRIRRSIERLQERRALLAAIADGFGEGTEVESADDEGIG